MARLKLDLDQDTYLKLLDSALAEKRPVDWQAEVVIRRAMGLPFPAEHPKRVDLALPDPRLRPAGT